MKKAAYFAIPILLLLYVGPILIITIGTVFDQVNGNTGLGRWFVSYLSAPSDITSLFYKALMPVTAGVTVATMWAKRSLWWTCGVLGLCIASMAAVAYLWVTAGDSNFLGNLWQPLTDGNYQNNAQLSDAIAKLLNPMAQSLSTYLFVLFGLQAIPKQPES